MRTLATALLLALPAITLSAAEFSSLELVRDGDDYRVLADVFIEAPAEGVFEVLTDYEGFPRLSSVFREGRVVEPIEDGRGVVYLHMKGCVLFGRFVFANEEKNISKRALRRNPVKSSKD